MGDRSDGKAVLAMIPALAEFTTFDQAGYTGVIYNNELVMMGDDGLVDQAAAGESNSSFVGVSENLGGATAGQVDASGSVAKVEKLNVRRRGVYKAAVHDTVADAEAVQAFQLVEGGSTFTLDLETHQRQLVYATGGATLDIDPDDWTAPLAGYVHKVTTEGGDGTGDCYVVLDAEWAQMMAAYLGHPAFRDRVIPLHSPRFDGVDLADRQVLVERFESLPTLAGSVDPSTATDPTQAEIDLIFQSNRHIMASGTNASATTQAHLSGGGIRCTTAGSDNDQVILSPRTNPANSTAWSKGWITANNLHLRAQIELAAITNILVHVRLSDSAVLDLTTDDDALGVQFSTEGSKSTTNFTVFSSRAGTDDAEKDTGVAVAAATPYRIDIVLDDDRNGDLVATTDNAMTSVTDWLPVIGVQALTGSGKSLDVRYVACAQNYDAAA